MKTFLIVLLVLIGAIIVGYYAMPDAEFSVEEPSMDKRTESADTMEMEPVPLKEGSYVLVPEESVMRWQGSRPLIEGYFDHGVISMADGNAVVASGSVTRAEVTVDMISVAAEATGRGSGESMLTNHLKSSDWFDAETYPESHFVITSYEGGEDGMVTVTGDLTIKDITDSLTFPAFITMHDGNLVVEATDIEVDRTVWDLRYQSGSFFGDLGDKLIDDIFTLTFAAVFEPVVAMEADIELQ